MLENTASFSSYSVDDLAKAKHFYGEVLGLMCSERPEGLALMTEGSRVFLYEKPDHEPASFTVLNFLVADIDAAVDALTGKGIEMERYPNFGADERGVVRNDGQRPGPRAIAWFKDPAGNVLAVIQEK